MEVSRLTTVKMLLLDEESYQNYFNIPIPRRYKSIENVLKNKNLAQQIQNEH